MGILGINGWFVTLLISYEMLLWYFLITKENNVFPHVGKQL